MLQWRPAGRRALADLLANFALAGRNGRLADRRARAERLAGQLADIGDALIGMMLVILQFYKEWIDLLIFNQDLK